MTEIILAGRSYQAAEPCFKNLRKIITAYNQLSVISLSQAEKFNAVTLILAAITNDSIALKQLKSGELEALLAAIPQICHLKPSSVNKGESSTDWGFVYAHLSACFGWTYDYIDNNMTLSRLEEYQAYLKKYPPIHQLGAAYLGYEYQDKQEASNFLANLAAHIKANPPKPL